MTEYSNDLLKYRYDAGLITKETYENTLKEYPHYVPTYRIKDDDARLRSDTGSFEKQRADYPVRREFPAFTVSLDNDTDGRAAVILREIGFNVKQQKD